MKVLIVNTSERTGGAAVAANRLMHALNKHGHKASMLVRDKQSDSTNVVAISSSWIKHQANFLRFAWERFVIFTYNRFSKKNLFSVSIANTGNNISQHSLVHESDIIHLHWINQGLLSLKNIQQLTKLNKPIVWTMHDMWPCTAICHHARECINYQTHCHRCFYLQHPTDGDLSSKIFQKKQQLLNNSNITFITCSHWLLNKAKSSTLLAQQNIICIPNTINTERFKPLDKVKCRENLGLPINKKLLFFSAANISNPRKGFNHFAEAAQILAQTTIDVELVVIGNVKEGALPALPFKTHYLNYVSSEDKLVEIYNAVDIYVTPSLEENLPNTIMEAMACGTPCVGFNVGGIPEMIDHKINGYVAQYESTEDLATGIQWCLNYPNSDTLSIAAREKVSNSYSETVVAKQHLELYQKLTQS